MGKKRVMMRLYRQHDMDLIVLYLNKEFGFMKALKHALHCYSRKEAFLFSAPDLEEFGIARELKYRYCLTVTLDTEKDADIIKLLERVKPNNRNEFIKCVMRGSMIGPYAYGCLSGADENLEAESIVLAAQSAATGGLLDAPPARNKVQEKKQKKQIQNGKKHQTKEPVGRKISKSKPNENSFKNTESELDKETIAPTIFTENKTTNHAPSEVESKVGNEEDSAAFFAELNAMLGGM